MTTVETLVTSDEVAAYQRDGVVCIRGLFRPWVEELSAAVDRHTESPPPDAVFALGDEPGLSVTVDRWPTDGTYRRFIFESPAAHLAGLLMGASHVRVYEDATFVKQPGTQAPTPWHQDLPYFTVRGTQVCAVWLALDAVDLQNGAVEYVVGSHTWSGAFQPLTGEQGWDVVYDEAVTPIPDIAAQRDRYTIVSFDLEPGDCVIHHGATVHGGPHNASDRRRRAVVTRWLGDDAVWTGPPNVLHAGEGLQPGDPPDCDEFPEIWVAPPPAR
jgi:ectoine hydroxylase-related dioxygenase (phytanoyl-CoA dioxygenase family)